MRLLVYFAGATAAWALIFHQGNSAAVLPYCQVLYCCGVAWLTLAAFDAAVEATGSWRYRRD